MRLHATNIITFDCPEPCPTVAMLRPRSGAAQWVISQRYHLDPWIFGTEYQDVYGNLCQRFTAPAGTSTVRVETEVEVEDVVSSDPTAAFTPIAQVPDDALIYLLPSRYCPADGMADRANDITQGASPGYGQVASICEWIRNNVEYRYGVSSQTTDALQTIVDKAGVCRDFSHVAIGLCRALQIPARFVAGYLHQLDPMDMHAWFEAFVGGRWYTFDATQDTLRPGRIVVAYGRDAADVAFMSNYGEMNVTHMEVTVRRSEQG
ncbi:MAG: transglutaminase family protein [Burkholderiales bacterium]|nr:MAG: transglutaminase family protein [Burkholderiales bacterium]